jgi:hypothetical protein
MGLRVERALASSLPDGKFELLRRARARMRERQVEVARPERAAAIRRAANSPTALGRPKVESAGTVTATALPAADLWGYLDELELGRRALEAEYKRPLSFATKGSTTLGRRHVQVKAETEEIARRRERAEQEAAAAAAAEEEEVAAELARAKAAAMKRAALIKSLSHE